MRGHLSVLTAAAFSFCSLSSAASADLIDWSTSGGNEGQVAAFDGSAFDTITDAGDAAFNATGAFNASGLLPSAINFFFVDFSASSGSAANAGLTLFGMWGTSDTAPVPDLANTLMVGDPFVGLGADINNPTSGANEAFVWGSLIHDSVGPNSAFIQTSPSQFPTGFAITNFNFGLPGSLAEVLVLNFTEGQGIEDWGLFSDGTGSPAVTGGFSSGGEGTEDTLNLAIPAPASIFVLAGFAGMARRRRRTA